MSKEEVKTERHTETKEEAIKNMRKIVEVEEENHVETKEEAVKRVAEPLSVTIEKAKKDINTAVIMAERNYGLHSSITVLILESVLANVRAGNATVAAMEFEQYKGELLADPDRFFDIGEKTDHIQNVFIRFSGQFFVSFFIDMFDINKKKIGILHQLLKFGEK